MSPPTHDPGKILCVGRLSHEKGHLVLIDSLAILQRRGCPFQCTLVGEGPLRPAIESRRLEQRLQFSVTLTGALPSEHVMRLYRNVDLVVSPSLSEGIPVVLMEAMAAGLPVVATRVGGIPELVRHGLTGLLVAPGDTLELAEAIQWVLEYPVPARQLGSNARNLVRQEFHLETSAARLTTLFEQAINARKNARGLF
jgi:colanic acid/amylovoran biosynthesis glycosyltransferase